MPVTGPWETKKVLITARTYPTPARKGVEVSCTGGITDQGEWIRLFPIPYRFLTSDKRFSKYSWVEVRVARSSDPRPESFEVDLDSIKILSPPIPPDHRWIARRALVDPLKAHCLCCLQAQRAATGSPTLGLFRPKYIRRLLIRPDAPNWSPAELGRLSQYSLFQNAPRDPLEKIPFKFIYQFYCDEAACRGHHLSCTDWEMGQAYRSWRDRYGSGWEAKFRQRFEDDMIFKYDTHFFVGTVRIHPASWIIVGLYYPPK